MDQLKEALESNLQKIKQMEDFISLSLRRENIGAQLVQIVKETSATRQFMEDSMQMDKNKIIEEYEKTMCRMRVQQKIILDHMIDEQERKLEEKKKKTEIETSVKKKDNIFMTASKTPEPSFANLNLQQGYATPKMSLFDYKGSPLVKRTKPHPIQFTDFEVQMTPQLFDTIPKYMRGRETFDELNNFLDAVVIPCFNDKYKLLYRLRNTVRNPNELELWKAYNQQVSYVPGQHFITPGDISRKINKMIDKKLQNRLTMLRHIGVLQEQRIGQTVCYVWKGNCQ